MDIRNGNGQKPKWLSPSVILLILAIIFALVLGGTSIFIVDQTEDAVITRFGKYTTTVGPGLHFKLPFGIDRNYNVPTKTIQTEQFGFRTVKGAVQSTYQNNLNKESTMLTGDLNIIDVEWIIQYRINDSRAWLFNVNEDVRDTTIRDISQSVINNLVGDRAILDVIGPERPAIEANSVTMMNAKFAEFGLGVTVTNVQLQNIVPPAGVQSAFEDVNKAIQDMNRMINEGKEAYNTEIPKASGDAEKMILEAQGSATERVNKAKGDVARFNSVYAEYVKAPEVTRRRLYLETIESILGSDSGTTLVDKKLGNFMPLKNLTPGATVSAAQSSAANAASGSSASVSASTKGAN
jgi:membrane protease subunit HflK